MSDEVRYVRLRPYNPKAGHVVRDFSQRFNGKFYRFREAGIWYKVPLALADVLAQARQMPGQRLSPPVFDVHSEKEARDLDFVAKREREAKKAVVEPTVETAREIKIEAPGRGDLSLEEVTAGRAAALESFEARALAPDVDVKAMDATIPGPTEDELLEPAPSLVLKDPTPKPMAKPRRGGRRAKK